ncbi:MAG: serine/threonine-protein kinase [Planctomycetota bacterium]|nr:serine/threonine-protein kinase [Planctomycetota bacterium]
MLNRNFDEFELGELIATGTAGKIYHAVDKTQKRIVALKILPQDVSKDNTIYIRFEREMIILGKLDHPNVVKYYGGGQHDDSLFYAMEKIEGGTLRQFINKHGKLTCQETVNYGIRICSALQYLHNYGIVHRDVKPANIFITYDGEIKLGDFGIAFDSGETELTESGLIVGSYAYMAPEQIRGDQQADARADLYAFGCVLFEMLAGKAPFRGDTFAKIFDQHLNTPAPDLEKFAPGTPASVTDLVRQLMKKERHQRPFNARAAQGILSELKYRWEENETMYQSELTRRQQAFDSQSLHNQPEEVSWQKLGILLAITGIIVVTALMFTTL